MRLENLEQYGIPQRVIERWRERQGDTLLPVQRRAVREGLLGNHDNGKSTNLVISAPTSAGKSFCAELAAVWAVMNRRKALLLFPLKSLAEETLQRLNATYAELGLRLLIVTGDHPENDRSFLAGKYDIAIAIYEKADMLLAADLDALGGIGLIAVDELQMLAEPKRGVVLERTLTKVIASSYHPDILALSAVLDETSGRQLADWLQARLIVEHHRPVDLLRGVAADGSVRYRSYNTTEDSDESFSPSEPDHGLADLLIEQLRGESGQSLVFLKSRQDTVQLAFRLAASSSRPAAQSALDALADEEPSFLIRSLRQALRRGVAFHNADLTPYQRSVLEKSFRNGELHVLCSTTTLALGVNLPADRVYLETVRYEAGAYDTRPHLVPITRNEFDNMTGRAGRLGLVDGAPGRAVVLAETDFDRDILWRQYIAPDEPDKLDLSRLQTDPDDWLLHMAASNLVRSVDSVRRVAEQSLVTIDLADSLSVLARMRRLEDRGLLKCIDDRTFTATSRGWAAVAAGLTVRETEYLAAVLNDDPPRSDIGWLALALSTPDFELPPGLLTRAELARQIPARSILAEANVSPSELSWLVSLDELSRPLGYRQTSLLKALLVVDAYRRMSPVQQLEERYQLHLGQVMRLAETVAHFLSAAASLAEADGEPEHLVDDLRTLAWSVREGLTPDLRALHQNCKSILGRSDLIRLAETGIRSVGELLEQPDKELANVILSKSKILKIKELQQSLKPEDDAMAMRVHSLSTSTAEPESIEVDGTYDRERFVVKINGLPVRLTGKSFKYFTKLAWSRLHNENGWIYKEEIEVGFNQARYLYRMKNEISAELDMPWPIVENNRLGYYRLRVDPSKIYIDQDKLRDHPDFEVRSLVGDNPGTGAVN